MSSSITERSSKQAVKTLRTQKNTDARLLKRDSMKSLAGGNLKRTKLACSGKSFQNKLKGPRGFSKRSQKAAAYCVSRQREASRAKTKEGGVEQSVF